MGQPRIDIFRRTGGLGRFGDNERTWSGLCMSGVEVVDTLELNKVYELNSVNDARNLGIDEGYDNDNVTLAFYHIAEFFRIAPGAKLFILVVSQATTLSQMADKDETYGLAKLLRDPLCKGKVRQAGLARNPALGYTPTLADGIDSDVLATADGIVFTGAVVQAQALAEEERQNKRPVHIFMEARSVNGTSADFIDASDANCAKVHLVGLQDVDKGLEQSIYEGHAAVGTVLGMRAFMGISRSLANPGEGEPGTGNIQDAATPAFLNPGLSSALPLSEYTDLLNGDRDVFFDKRLLIPRVFQDHAGVYLSSDFTCDVTSSDYVRGSYNMVANEAERIIYKDFVPKTDADIKVNPTTGRLNTIVIKGWERECAAKLQAGLAGNPDDNTGDVSSVDCFIDPNQNFLSSDTIQVEAIIVPKGHAKTIKVYIGFKNPFLQQ